MGRNRGQVGIFVLVGLVLVGGVLGYLAVREGLFITGDDAAFGEAYTLYDSCIRQALDAGVDLAEAQGGRIVLPAFEQGSEYAPTGNQLSFLGQGVPYWMYTSGNGLVKEQVPTIDGLERELGTFVAEELKDCSWDTLRARGFDITPENPTVTITITRTQVQAEVDQTILFSKDTSSVRVTERTLALTRPLGTLFEEALAIYAKQREEAYLDAYTVDLLSMYAPVDGVAVQCSPMIWKTREVVAGLRQGIEGNIQALQFNSKPDGNRYFSVAQSVRVPVRTLFDARWPHRIEIHGAEQELMKAEPVGTQAGLGILGFCYAPYHFVYDVQYPVLYQLGEPGEDVFQFPVVVVVDKNAPRKALEGELVESSSPEDVCQFKTQPLTVRVSDVTLAPVDATIRYACFDQECTLGTTENGVFTGLAPACVNGQLIARADGFTEKRTLFSSNDEFEGDLILDRLYVVNVSVRTPEGAVRGQALVSFIGPASATAVVPEQSALSLSEGLYNVSVMVYGNTSITLPATSTRQCTTIAAPGLSGIFGGTKEQCFEIPIPETKLDSALVGGGQGEVYLFPSDLERGQITVTIGSVTKPTSLDDVQRISTQIEGAGLEVSFA